MATTNATTANARMSYVLAGKLANQATAKATAESAHVLSKATAAAANGYTEDAKTLNRLSVNLMTATAAAATAATAAAATAAATAAAKTATAAKTAAHIEGTHVGLTAIGVKPVANEVALNALSVAGAYAYFDATAATWASMREDVASATFERKTTTKAARMQLVVERTNGKTVYLTVNTTAAMDWRKIDAAYNRRLANQAKKTAAKKTAAKKTAAKKTAAKKTAAATAAKKTAA